MVVHVVSTVIFTIFGPPPKGRLCPVGLGLVRVYSLFLLAFVCLSLSLSLFVCGPVCVCLHV